MMKPYLLLTGSIVLAVAALAYSCSVVENNANALEDQTVTVECKFYYRAAAKGGEKDVRGERKIEFEEKKVELTVPVGDGPQPEIGHVVEPKVVKFDSFEISVTHQINSLVVNVMTKKGEQIMTQLFQFDPKLKNQFVGGHGFSGLIYVYHPEDKSELQFICKVK